MKAHLLIILSALAFGCAPYASQSEHHFTRWQYGLSPSGQSQTAADFDHSWKHCRLYVQGMGPMYSAENAQLAHQLCMLDNGHWLERINCDKEPTGFGPGKSAHKDDPACKAMFAANEAEENNERHGR